MMRLESRGPHLVMLAGYWPRPANLAEWNSKAVGREPVLDVRSGSAVTTCLIYQGFDPDGGAKCRFPRMP
jgi:hypothetical protein